MTNRIWQNFLASNIHRGINKVAAQKSSSSKNLPRWFPTCANHQSWNNFCQALVSPNYHLPCQDAPRPRSLELESMRTGGHPDRWADIQSAQLHSGNNFCKALVSLKCNFPCQDVPHPRSLELESLRTGGHPDRWADIQSAQLHSGNNFCKALVSLKLSPRTVT